MDNNIMTKAQAIASSALTTGAIASLINTALYLLATTTGVLSKTVLNNIDINISWINVLFGTFFSVVLLGGFGSLIASIIFKANAPAWIFVAGMIICLVSFFSPFSYNLDRVTSNEMFNFVAVFNLLHAIAAYIASPALANAARFVKVPVKR
jgi:hypothetical protein